MIYLFLILHPQTGSGGDNISNFLVSFLHKFTFFHQAAIHYYYTVVIFAISCEIPCGSQTASHKSLWLNGSVDFFKKKHLVFGDFLN